MFGAERRWGEIYSQDQLRDNSKPPWIKQPERGKCDFKVCQMRRMTCIFIICNIVRNSGYLHIRRQESNRRMVLQKTEELEILHPKRLKRVQLI